MYNVNQVNQLFVVKNVVTGTDKPTVAGDIKVCTHGPLNGDPEMLYFKYMGKGGLIRTDLVPLKVVLGSHDLRVSITEDTAMADTMASAKISISSDANDIIAGETYGFKVILPHLYDEGDESIYTKYAYVKAVSGDDDESIAGKLAQNLYINLNRYHKDDIFNVYYGATQITENNKNATLSGATDISIVAVPQPWERGLMPQTKISFEISWNPITKDEEEYMDWMSVAMGSANAGVTIPTVGNGTKIADLEYFLMGERGDQYRMMGYPNYVKTNYMISDSDIENKVTYDIVSVHYSFIGHNEDNKRGEKDLTFAFPVTYTTTTVDSTPVTTKTSKAQDFYDAIMDIIEGN